MASKQTPTPEDVTERLRAIRAEFEEMTHLSASERRDLRNKIKTSEDALLASISIISSSEKVAHALSRSAEDVLEMFSDRQRWFSVESELRTFLNGVSSANLVRRSQLEMIAGHAYAIAVRLARDPANADLIPYVEAMQRLKKLERRRRRASRTEPEAEPEPEKAP